MRQYECQCMSCGTKRQVAFKVEPYPELGDVFLVTCRTCQAETSHSRVLTRKAKAEVHRRQQEEDLRNSIGEKCSAYGFSYRFLYRSVIVTTPLADWCFDYHNSLITLYHESTIKINFETKNYAKSHVQFADRQINPLDVIDYIAAHDEWRQQKNITNTNSE